MTKRDKLLKKLFSKQPAFTWDELITLMGQLGFEKREGAGSRVKFYNGSTGIIINLHKPHPGNILKKYIVKNIVEKLKAEGIKP